MELKEFIKKSLRDIVLGISEAQEELKETGAIINPSAMEIDNNGIKTISPEGNGNGRLIQKVEMTLAVSSKKLSGGALNIEVLGFEAKNKSENVSTLKFNIPVSFPVQETKFKNRANWVAT